MKHQVGDLVKWTHPGGPTSVGVVTENRVTGSHYPYRVTTSLGVISALPDELTPLDAAAIERYLNAET